MVELILIGICLLLTVIAVVVYVCSYRLNNKEKRELWNMCNTRKVFSSKLSNTDISINCAVKNLESYNSFEELVGKEVFD